MEEKIYFTVSNPYDPLATVRTMMMPDLIKRDFGYYWMETYNAGDIIFECLLSNEILLSTVITHDYDGNISGLNIPLDGFIIHGDVSPNILEINRDLLVVREGIPSYPIYLIEMSTTPVDDATDLLYTFKMHSRYVDIGDFIANANSDILSDEYKRRYVEELESARKLHSECVKKMKNSDSPLPFGFRRFKEGDRDEQ